MSESLHQQWEIKKISSRSKEDFEAIKEEREKQEKYEILPSEIFGSDVLHDLKKIENLLPKNNKTQELRTTTNDKEEKDTQKYSSLEEVAHNAFGELQTLFQEYIATTSDIDALAKKMNIDYENMPELQKVVEKRMSDKKNKLSKEEIRKHIIIEDLAYMLAKKSKDSEIDSELVPIVIAALEKHQHEMLKKEEEMRKDIPQLMEKFKKRIKKAAEKGIFPIDPEVLEERLGIVRFHIIDPIMSKLQNKYGDYSADTHTVRLSTNMQTTKESPNFIHKILHLFSNKDDNKFSTFTHEVFHGLSGQSKITMINKEYEDIRGSKVSRVGLNLHKQKEIEKKKTPSFTWLNEGLTEQAAVDLLERKESESYEPERELLQILIKHGVSRELLYKAYFDNYTIRKAGEHRTPALKELFVETNKKFGDRFLINLDQYISAQTIETGSSSKGVRQAIDVWKKEDSHFPEYLESWANEYRKTK